MEQSQQLKQALEQHLPLLSFNNLARVVNAICAKETLAVIEAGKASEILSAQTIASPQAAFETIQLNKEELQKEGDSVKPVYFVDPEITVTKLYKPVKKAEAKPKAAPKKAPGTTATKKSAPKKAPRKVTPPKIEEIDGKKWITESKVPQNVFKCPPEFRAVFAFLLVKSAIDNDFAEALSKIAVKSIEEYEEFTKFEETVKDEHSKIANHFREYVSLQQSCKTVLQKFKIPIQEAAVKTNNFLSAFFRCCIASCAERAFKISPPFSVPNLFIKLYLFSDCDKMMTAFAEYKTFSGLLEKIYKKAPSGKGSKKKKEKTEEEEEYECEEAGAENETLITEEFELEEDQNDI